MKQFNGSYVLNKSSIDEISESIRAFMAAGKVNGREVTRACLSVEVILMKWLEDGLEGKECKIYSKKWLGQQHIVLELAGTKIDPMEKTAENDEDDLSRKVHNYTSCALENMKVAMRYQYVDGVNTVDITIPRPPMGMLPKIGIAIMLAFVLGTLTINVTSPDMAAYISKDVISPAFAAIMSLVKTTAVLMVFTSIIAGIVNIGDMSTLKSIGGVFLKTNMISTAVIGVSFTAVMCSLFDVMKVDNDKGVNLFGTVYQLFLGIIPPDIISPFSQGNTLQIVFIAVCVGIITILLRQNVPHIINVMTELNMITMYAIRCICQLVPLIIFLSFMRMVLDGGLAAIVSAWKMPVTAFILATLANILVLIAASKRCGASLGKLFKNIFPLYLMGATTCSSTTCMPVAEAVLCKKYGVENGLFAFAYPLGQMLNKGMNNIRFLIYVIGLAEIWHIQFGLGECVTLAIVSILLSLTVPPIPGGSMALITIMLDQFGIPEEALAIAISMEFILDMIVISGAVTCNVSEILVLAHKVKRCKKTPEWE